MRESNGLRHLPQLMLGVDELQWSQDERLTRRAYAQLGIAHECGWVAEWVGPSPNLGWEVYNGGGGALRTRSESEGIGEPFPVDRTRGGFTPFLGVDRGGNVVEVDPHGALRDAAGAAVVVPNDGVWYTLVARYAVTVLEPGAMSVVGGSTTVTGSDTHFTRYADSTEVQPTLIRIDAADTANGNEGTYEIDTITDDESMTLVSAPPRTESGIRFRVKGQFFSGDPADADEHNNTTIAWELVARTTTRPTDGALIGYDVKQTAGTTVLIDRRRANIYQPYDGRSSSFALAPAWIRFLNSNSGDSTAFDAMRDSFAVPNLVLAISMAPCSSGSELAGLAEDQPTGVMAAVLNGTGANNAIRVKHFTVLAADLGSPTALAGGWDDPDNGAAVDVVASAGLQDVAIIALPASSGFTHICFYIDTAGDLFSKTSADNGATWVGPATVWQPSSTDTVSRVAAVLTRMNRIVVITKYSVGSNRIKAIYSDDLGATWDKNTNAGYDVGGGTAVHDVSVVEDDRGNLWTVAAEGAVNVLRMYRGKAEGDAVPSATEQAAGWGVGADDSPAISNRLDSFALPNGMVGTIFDAGAVINQGDRIHYVGIARRFAVNHQFLVEGPWGAGTSAVPIGTCVSASGMVFMAWGNQANVRVFQYIPTRIDRAHSWYGGT